MYRPLCKLAAAACGALGLAGLALLIPPALTRATRLQQAAGPATLLPEPAIDQPSPPPTPDPLHLGVPAIDPALRGRERVAAIRERAAQQPPPPGIASTLAPAGWYENDIQGVRETWSTLGLTGTGVTIAVVDTGVDFANPALAGRYAVQTTTLSGTQAYAGWPVAFDEHSLSTYLADPARAWPANWGWYVNAAHAITGSGVFTFVNPQSPPDVYTVPGTSLSGRYLLGTHPDTVLSNTLLLVADETVNAAYDAVYADLDDDGEFETRMAREQPVGALDVTGDGIPDVSAGMLYWIADGANPPPGAEGVHGPGLAVPITGTLLAFMIDTHGHGTMCAGTAVGNDGGVFVPEPRIASFYTPATFGPLVQGPAPGARLVALGNVYAGGSPESWYLFTVLGYDGVAGSGDEPSIVTLSFDSGGIDNDGWDEESRLLTDLNLAYGKDSPLFIHAAGNGGFGYGTLTAPKAATGLVVGASTQYGTLNTPSGTSETVSIPSRVSHGDVAAFSNRGPGADGTRAVDLVANGIFGTGAYPLNSPYVPDGTFAYVNWYGTSRGAPVTGGVAALATQAFRRANGRSPTYAEVRRLLINGGRDLGYDPLVQGAGRLDAFRTAQVALKQYGVTVDPPAAVAGDFRGERYASFAAGLAQGQAYTLPFTVTNPGAVTVTVTLGARHLVEVAHYTATIHTITDTTTNYGYGAPDYALELTDWVTAHPAADLMVVRTHVPFEHFDVVPPTPDVSRNRWRLTVYNWWDDHADDTWWSDGNGDGRVDWPGEVDTDDEWMRFDYSRLDGTQHEVRVGRPYSRSLGAGSTGVWAGAAHTTRSPGDNRTTLRFDVRFYRQAAWPEVQISASALALPPGGEAAFHATVHVPPDAPHGLYQGTLVVGDTGRTDLDPAYRPHETLVPLTWQVWGDPAGGITLGGTPPAGTPYDNGRIAGGFNWSGRKESGDWRLYGLDLYSPAEGSVLLAHDTWQDYPTDVDTLIFGPSPDAFSDADPARFGPYSLDLAGGSVRAGFRPAWEFQTATGGPEEWVAAPAREGLHVLAHQAILYGGYRTSVPFTTEIGLAHVAPYPLQVSAAACSNTCTLTATLRASLDLPDGITGTHGFGWFTPATTLSHAITQGQIATHPLSVTEPAYLAGAQLVRVTGAARLDVCLWDDGGPTAGAWEQGDGLLACVSAPGEDLRARDLSPSLHWVTVEGTGVTSPAARYDLRTTVVPASSDGALSFGGLPATVDAHQAAPFAVRVEQPPVAGARGLLVLGPPALPHALEVEVRAVWTAYLPLAARSE